MPFYTSAEKRGDHILFRGYQDNGSRVQRRVSYHPYLFVPAKGGAKAEYTSLIGKKPLAKMVFDSMREAQDYLEQYKDVHGFEVHGSDRWVYNFINDFFPGEVSYKQSFIKTAYIDIEVDSEGGFPNIALADKHINAITLSDGKKFWVFGLKPYDVDFDDADEIQYIHCGSERELLFKFLEAYQEIDPDVITGWNVEGFDVPYIYKRMKQICGTKVADSLSPWGITRSRQYHDKMGRENDTVNLSGVETLDYLQLYLKFTYSRQEQYSLDYISKVELGDEKVDYRSLGYKDLNDLYQRNHKLFIDYNIHDVRLVIKLEQKMKFIEQAIAYDAKINYSDALTSVLLWDVIIHNYLLDQKVVVPVQETKSKDQQIAGGYVKNPTPGRYDWLISFDLNSLYPHLIMQYNISPEKFVGMHPHFSKVTVEDLLNGNWEPLVLENLKKSNYAIAGNGSIYSRDGQGVLPALMQKYYDDRKVWKKRMIEAKKKLQDDPDNEDLKAQIVHCNNMQMAKKISLNSAYGALSNQWFRFYDDRLAEAITLSGQLSITWAADKMNEYLNNILGTKGVDYVIASDTDSLYILVGPLVDKLFKDKSDKHKIVDTLDQICENKIQPFIDQFYQELADKMNAFEQKMAMKREAIAERGIWSGAKRYIMSIWNNEGVAYKEPYFKMTGIEAVRASTPTICRGAIEEAAKIVISDDQQGLYKYVDEFRKCFMTADVAQIAKNSSVKIGTYKLGDSGLPMHVKGALAYNKMVRELNLETKYERIKDGDRVKVLPLKMPNPSQEKCISFTAGELPVEFGLERYVDREDLFKTGFFNPVETIANAAGLQVEKKDTLMDFFV